MKGEELKAELDISMISSLIRVTVLNKPLKNKLVHIRLGNKDHVPNTADYEALCVEMTKIVNLDPVNFSNCQFIVTGHDIDIKSYSLEKLKKRFTIFIVKAIEHFDELREQISAQLTVLKVPMEKFMIVKIPIRVERPTSEAKQQ